MGFGFAGVYENRVLGGFLVGSAREGAHWC